MSISHAVRHGFTLIEVVVAALIVGLLSAVAVPQLIDFIDYQRSNTTATTLTALGTGVSKFGTLVTVNPLRVNELANVIVATSAASHNSCQATFTVAQVTNWNTNGPFVSFYIPTTGLVTPIGTLADSMIRNPLTTATAGTLAIQITNVDTVDAARLDKIIDGGDGNAAGSVQWTAPGAGSSQTTVKFFMPIGAKC